MFLRQACDIVDKVPALLVSAFRKAERVKIYDVLLAKYYTQNHANDFTDGQVQMRGHLSFLFISHFDSAPSRLLKAVWTILYQKSPMMNENS